MSHLIGRRQWFFGLLGGATAAVVTAVIITPTYRGPDRRKRPRGSGDVVISGSLAVIADDHVTRAAITERVIGVLRHSPAAAGTPWTSSQQRANYYKTLTQPRNEVTFIIHEG